jgi:hypothetical protein
MVKKAVTAMKQTRGIEERRFKNNLEKDDDFRQLVKNIT